MNDVRMVQGDLLPELGGTQTDPIVIRDGKGNVIDLSSATVKFLMKAAAGSIPKIDAAAVVVSGVGGQVKYVWAGTDTDTPGRYKAVFQATIASKKFTAPNNGYITVIILPKLA